MKELADYEPTIKILGVRRLHSIEKEEMAVREWLGMQ